MACYQEKKAKLGPSILPSIKINSKWRFPYKNKTVTFRIREFRWIFAKLER